MFSKRGRKSLRQHNAARKQALLLYSVATKTAYKRNTTEIERLEKELEELTLQTDRDLSKENTEEAAFKFLKLKGKLPPSSVNVQCYNPDWTPSN